MCKIQKFSLFIFAFQSLLPSYSLSSLICSTHCPICCADILVTSLFRPRWFINRLRNNLLSRNPLLRHCAFPRWSLLVSPGRRISFIQDHISTLISRIVIHRSHHPGLLSARSSSSSASLFCSLSLSYARKVLFFFFFRDE